MEVEEILGEQPRNEEEQKERGEKEGEKRGRMCKHVYDRRVH